MQNIYLNKYSFYQLLTTMYTHHFLQLVPVDLLEWVLVSLLGVVHKTLLVANTVWMSVVLYRTFILGHLLLAHGIEVVVSGVVQPLICRHSQPHYLRKMVCKSVFLVGTESMIMSMIISYDSRKLHLDSLDISIKHRFSDKLRRH